MSSLPSAPSKNPTITITSMDYEHQGQIHSRRSVMTKRSSRNIVLLILLAAGAFFISNSWSNADFGESDYLPQGYFTSEQQDLPPPAPIEPLGYLPSVEKADGLSSPDLPTSGQRPALEEISDPSELGRLNLNEFPNATIGKITMLYGDPNPVYERALQTHIDHGKVHNYPTFVLRQKLLGRLWSKPAYILSVILNELQKPPEEQLKWLFWFDADTVLINPKIPLEMFLPPSPEFDHIHFLCGNDHHGLNDGAFLLRVGDYAMHLMAAALSVEGFRPEVSLRYSEQSAIEHVIHSNDLVRPWEGFAYSDGYAEIPQRWMNAYMGPRYEDGTIKPKKQLTGNSVKEGDMLVHFAGSGDTKRRRMTKFMDVLEKDRTAWEVDPKQTEYDEEIAQYWTEMTKLEVEQMEKEAKNEGGKKVAGAPRIGEKITEKPAARPATKMTKKPAAAKPEVVAEDKEVDVPEGEDKMEPEPEAVQPEDSNATADRVIAAAEAHTTPAPVAAAITEPIDIDPNVDVIEDGGAAAVPPAPAPAYGYPAPPASAPAGNTGREFRMGKIRRVGKH